MKRWIRPASLLLVLALGLAVAGELALRIFWPELFPHHVAGLHVPHPELGHVLAPDREVEMVRPEYAITARINRDGFRGAALATEPPDLRIVCIGDWATFGEGVVESETYPARLESRLRAARPGRRIEVVNAGVPQYATVDELAWLRTFVGDLAPDVVVAQFYAGDDLEQNAVPARDRYEFRGDELYQRRSFNRANEPGFLVFVNTWKHRSHLVNQVSERVGSLLMRLGLLARVERASGTYFGPEQAERSQQLLAEIERVATGAGARTLFLFVPEKMQVLGGDAKPLRAARLVEQVARNTGAGFVDLTNVLRDPALQAPLLVAEERLAEAAARHEVEILVAPHRIVRRDLG